MWRREKGGGKRCGGAHMTTTVGQMGEFELIAAIAERLPRSDHVLIGPGDDAAVLRPYAGSTVITTDSVIEDRHFRRDWSLGYDVGRKGAARSLSDICAMGGQPLALVTALAFPASLELEWLLRLVDGFRDECDLVGASVVGGDLSRANFVMIGITAVGSLAPDQPAVTRSGARPGDQVVVAGRLGFAEAGLALLRAGETGPEELLDAHRRPKLPYDSAPLLVAAGATAMCDVSDGLLQDLGHVAYRSQVVINVDSARLPVPPVLARAATTLRADALTWMLTGGDDYALVACLPPQAAVPPECLVIGAVIQGGDEGMERVLVDKAPWAGPAGHDHFRTRS